MIFRNIFLLLTLFCARVSAQNFEWAKSFGGTTNDIGYSVIVDLNGNVFSTGFFRGTVDFDPGLGNYSLTSFGGSDIFITKLDLNGNFLWAKQIGGAGEDEAHAIELDNAGNIYLSGYFSSNADFDPSSGTYPVISNGSTDLFISKYNNQGNIIWAKGIGGSSADESLSLTLDKNGNSYATGSFCGTVDFNPGTGTNYLTASSTYYNAYILELDSSGGFIMAKSISGSIAHSQGYSIKTDSTNNIYLTGYFSGNCDFDPNVGTNFINSVGTDDVFILKLNSSGTFIWANSFGSINKGCNATSILIDVKKNVYITGNFGGTPDFDSGIGTYTISSNGQGDAYLLKLDSSGIFNWVKRFGGTADDYGFGIKIDQSKNIFLMGDFSTTVDFNPGAEINTLTSAGILDVYILKLDSLGNYISVKNFGGLNIDAGYSLCIDENDNLYISGFFEGSAQYNPGFGNTVLTSNGFFEVFILKLNSSEITQLNNYSLPNLQPINIYPNPNNGTFMIVSKENINLNLINNLGQIIQTIQLNNSNNNQVKLEGISSGIYLLQSKDFKYAIQQKIIVTN